MPFFQGAYNFEVHGGSFRDFRHLRRRHQSASARRNSHRSTSLPTPLPPALEHANSDASEKIIDEEAQTLADSPSRLESIWTSLTDALPSQIYMQLLLHLPSHYFNRVDRLSRDADMALKEILDLAVQSSVKCGNDFQTKILDLGQDSPPTTLDPESLPPAYRCLTVRWKCFIETLLEEWRTLNLVSALLIPGILTMFQVIGASNDPVTRYLAFWSLISALISLLYGCAFIIQFSRMRKPSIAIEWAFEAQNPRSALWSVGVMLSLPVVWLAWSIVAFIVCIMAFMWRCGANPPDQFPVPPNTELAFRIFVSVVLGIGVHYGVLISVSFQRYGPKMDEALSRRIDAYIASAASSSSVSTQLSPSELAPSQTVTSFRKSPKQKSKRRRPRSRSSSLFSASASPLASRSVSLGQSSSTSSYQPSPLSTSTSADNPSDTVTHDIKDSNNHGGAKNIRDQLPLNKMPSGVIGLQGTESFASGRMTAIPLAGIMEENKQAQLLDDTHGKYNPTRLITVQDNN